MVRRVLHRSTRTVTVTLLALMVAVAVLTTLAFAAPNSAMANSLNPVDKICQNDQSMYLPEGSSDGARIYTTSSVEHVPASGDAAEGDGFTVINAPLVQWHEPGDGLTFGSFGLSMCHDTAAMIETQIGDITWQLVAVWPAKIVGMGLDWALSGALSTILLSVIKEPISHLYSGVFSIWAPLIIGLTLCGIVLNIARRRGQPFGDFAWMLGAIVLTMLFVSPTGLQLATTVTTTTGQIATCAAVAPMGGCKDGQGSVSSVVIDGMLAQAWGAGALGDMADVPAPTTITLNDDLKDSTPDIRDDYAVKIPVDAIPAGVDGIVSYADVLRWTNTYTDAEVSRLGAAKDGLAMRCSFRDRFPSVGDVTGKTHGDLDPQQICSYKAVIRAALYSDLATNHPAAYAAATGKGGGALGAALGALFGLLPLLVGVACIAFVGLIAEIELVLLMLCAPFVGLGAIRSAAVGKKWGQEIAASVVKRVSVGATLGVALWAVSAITATLTKVFAGAATTSGTAGVALTAVAPKVLPVAIAIVAALALLGAFKLLGKLQSILLAGVGLPEQAVVGQGVGRRAGSMALGVAMETVAAPATAAKTALSSVANLTRRQPKPAVDAATAATKPSPGVRPTKTPAGNPVNPTAGTRTPGSASAAMPGPVPFTFPPANPDSPEASTDGRVGPRAGDEQTADAAWERVTHTVTARAHRTERDHERRAAYEEATTRLRNAAHALDQHRRNSQTLVGLRADALERQGMPVAEAETRAVADVARAGDELTKAALGARKVHEDALADLRLADATPTPWEQAADQWARSGHTLQEAAEALGLSTEAERSAFEQYQTLARSTPVSTAATGSATGSDTHGFWTGRAA